MKPILVDEDRNQDYNEGPNGQGKPFPYGKAARPYPSNPPYASKYEADDKRPPSNHDSVSYPPPDSNSMHPPPFVGGRSNSVHSQYSNQSQPPPQSLRLRHLGNYAANQKTTMDGDMHRSVRDRLEVEAALRQGQVPTSFEAWLTSLSRAGKGKARSRKARAGKSQSRRSVVTVLQNLSHRVGTIRLATFLQPLAQIDLVNNLNDLYVNLSARPG
ncbi:MAG: hypothetical protein Q9192_007828 [Flavoplaca navasiana]